MISVAFQTLVLVFSKYIRELADIYLGQKHKKSRHERIREKKRDSSFVVSNDQEK